MITYTQNIQPALSRVDMKPRNKIIQLSIVQLRQEIKFKDNTDMVLQLLVHFLNFLLLQ